MSTRSLSRYFVLVSLSLVLAVLNGGRALAQQNVTSATLSGVVQDASRAFVTDATLPATSVETNQTQTARTDYDGRYRFPFLPVGPYKLNVDAAGFHTLTKDLTVTVGQSLYLPVKLEVAGVAETVTIASDVPAIEILRSQLSETVRPAEIDNLPLNGRNFLDLFAFVGSVPGCAESTFGKTGAPG